jgi:hypothetical protein
MAPGASLADLPSWAGWHADIFALSDSDVIGVDSLLFTVGR